jgi:hypothetical protein
LRNQVVGVAVNDHGSTDDPVIADKGELGILSS